MTSAIQAAFDAGVETPRHDVAGTVSRAAPRSDAATASAADIRLSLHTDLAGIESEWRAFEQHADCTVFQTFGYLSLWQRHIGVLRGVRPAIVTGRDGHGALLFLMPLAVEPHGALRSLTFLGNDLCDYNGILLASDFASRTAGVDIKALWRSIAALIRSERALRYDLVRLEKMPELIGEQRNPLLDLGTQLHPSGAHLTRLGDNWETYYSRRKAATRSGDRTKRRKLGEFGEVNFTTAQTDGDIARTLDVLMEQKAAAFAHMGVANIFDRPGYRAFYHAVTIDPGSRELTHVSRLDIGALCGAANFGLSFRGRYYHVLVSYDGGDVSRYGPGVAHLLDLMQRAIATGHHTYDFTIGDERYKSDWCEVHLQLFDHMADASWRGAPIAVPLQAMKRAKRWIKQTPAVWNLVVKARAAVAALRMKKG